LVVLFVKGACLGELCEGKYVQVRAHRPMTRYMAHSVT
jgi:hypothetical protein